MSKRLAGHALGLGLLLGSWAVHAAVVTYTFAGSASGIIDQTSFSSQNFTLVVTGDSATVQNGAHPFSNVLTGGTITIAGTACAGGCSVTSPGGYLVFNTGPSISDVHGISTVGNIDVAGETLLEGCFISTCGGPSVDDNLVSPVALTPSGARNALAPYRAFATSGGTVQIRLLDSLSYGVAVVVTEIPALSPAWMLVLAGLVAIGGLGVLRRRQRV